MGETNSKVVTKSNQVKSNTRKSGTNRTLLWIDPDAILSKHEACIIVEQLYHIINDVYAFSQVDHGIQYLKSNGHQTFFVVSSASLGIDFIKLVHDLLNVESIFIFSNNQIVNNRSMKSFKKVVGEYIQLGSLCRAVQTKLEDLDDDAESISFVNNQSIDPLFSYFQLLNGTLLELQHDQNDCQRFIRYCCKNFHFSSGEIEILKKFGKTYRSNRAIYYYSQTKWLSTLVKRAHYFLEPDLLLHMGFFIRDLDKHIVEVYESQVNLLKISSLVFYHAQGVSHDLFRRLKENQGYLISFNGFLRANSDRSTCLDAARRRSKYYETVGILFVIHIDLESSIIPFACESKTDVLFSLQSVFRIESIENLDKNLPCFRVELTPIDNEQREILVEIGYDTIQDSIDLNGWDRFGQVLIDFKRYKHAEEFYKTLIELTDGAVRKASYFFHLGMIRLHEERYTDALVYFKQAQFANHPNLTETYFYLAQIVDQEGKYDQALQYEHEILKLQAISNEINYETLTLIYNHLGSLYERKGDYINALNFYRQDLELIRQQTTNVQPDLAIALTNLGVVYDYLGYYDEALLYHENALKIKTVIYPPLHASLAKTYNNISCVYRNVGNYKRALTFCEKAFEIRQRLLHRNHPDLIDSYNNMALIHMYTCDLKRSLQLFEEILNNNYLQTATTHNNVGVICEFSGHYEQALVHHQRALTIKRKTLTDLHPSIAISLNNLGMVYEKRNNLKQALIHFEEALLIWQRCLPSTHLYLQHVQQILS